MHSDTSSSQGNEPEELDATKLDEVNAGAKTKHLKNIMKPAKLSESNKPLSKSFSGKKEAGNIILTEETETL